jgi:hypothetical protein
MSVAFKWSTDYQGKPKRCVILSSVNNTTKSTDAFVIPPINSATSRKNTRETINEENEKVHIITINQIPTRIGEISSSIVHGVIT